MTYGIFLILFLVLPALGLGIWLWRSGRVPWRLTLILGTIALAYTTLWDNYLVASRVWWYDPEKVLGVTLGWVPLEEYFFFILQPILASFWTFLVLHRRGVTFERGGRGRSSSKILVWGSVVIWLAALISLLAQWTPAKYLSLILIWAMPPLALQFAYGGGYLITRWRSVLISLLPPTLFLGVADALAISSGIWTINPENVVGAQLLGILPLEEFLFFTITNSLIVFTIMLVESRQTEPGKPRFAPNTWSMFFHRLKG
jgi:lycopene cyclase domain-containing protein